MPPFALHKQNRLLLRIASDRRRLVVQHGAAQPDAGEIQRHGMQVAIAKVNHQRAPEPGPPFFERAIVIGRQYRGRQRSRIGRLALGLGEQLFVFLAREEHSLRRAFQDDVQHIERNEDLADGLGGRSGGGLGDARGCEAADREEKNGPGQERP